VEVEEYDSLSSTMQNCLEFVIPELAGSGEPTVGVLCDILKPTSAKVVARYMQDYYSGKPAITINQFGDGQVVYVGAAGNGELYDVLSIWLLQMTGIKSSLAVPAGVEVTERWRNDQRLLFVLNHTQHPQQLTFDKRYECLLDNSIIEGAVSLAPHDILILRENAELY